MTLQEALNGTGALIAVLSPDHVELTVCADELGRACDLGMHVFPVWLRALAPEQWPLRIQRLQYVDFTNWKDPTSFDRGVAALVDRLQREKPDIVGQRPDPEQQYLSTLIADLKGRRGVVGYVLLAARCIASGVSVSEREVRQPLLGLLPPLYERVKQSEKKQAAYDDQMEKNPNVPWSSTMRMEDALDDRYGIPAMDLNRLRRPIDSLGPCHRGDAAVGHTGRFRRPFQSMHTPSVTTRIVQGCADQRSWGLVLSGGAACGLANIGVLDVLGREALRPGCVAGSSMGAIVAALYALGHPPAVMKQVTSDLAPASVVRLSSRALRSGLHGGVLEQQLERHLHPLIGDARIGDCDIPFVCVAGRVSAPIRWERLLTAGFLEHLRECVQAYVFPDDTRILDAIRASSAIPVIFTPAEVDGDEFVDLVHFGPIPARALRQVHAPEVVIATDTQPSYESIEPFMPGPLRNFLLAGREETALSIAACDLVVRPELPASPLRFDKGDAFFEAGASAARAHIDDIRALLQ